MGFAEQAQEGRLVPVRNEHWVGAVRVRDDAAGVLYVSDAAKRLTLSSFSQQVHVEIEGDGSRGSLWGTKLQSWQVPQEQVL